ncbi:MAG: dihydrodipicolinate synthase family protein [Acidobacteria bacterium]|nr:dihydrodipicolinate synthase family protein [Acidobacteriota bacterium]
MTASDLKGVFAVPPLARGGDGRLDWEANRRIAEYIGTGGVTRLMYGGNAFLYHLTLAEYADLVAWCRDLPETFWPIPSAGPSYGRLMDQAPLLRERGFPAVMVLPCGDPRDAAGLERGLRQFADAAATPLIVYIKEDSNLGTQPEAGLDAVARLVSDRVCVCIKYGIVREDPANDPYLDKLIDRVPRSLVISGMGERPAIVHLRDFRLAGFTSGSVCLAPSLSRRIFELCQAGRWAEAGTLRGLFLPFEDLRDAWGPARTLHHAVELAGIARMGGIPPFTSPLGATQLEALRDPAVELASTAA